MYGHQGGKGSAEWGVGRVNNNSGHGVRNTSNTREEAGVAPSGGGVVLTTTGG